MKTTPLSKQQHTTDNQINTIIENYMKRQAWMKTFINPKNKIYNVEYQ